MGRGIRTDSPWLPMLITENRIMHCVFVFVYFLPITVSVALASTGLAVLLPSEASQT